MKRWIHDKSEAEIIEDQIETIESSDDYEEAHYVFIDQKDVKDYDGFWTKYTLYKEVPSGRYVTTFGDPDIYSPEQGDTDAEFEDEDEAYQWFMNYHGFDDEDI